MDFFSDWNIRSVTQIVTASAAVVAALTGVYGVVNAVRSYRSSIASAERQAKNERRDQARFVHPIIVDWSQSPKGNMHAYQARVPYFVSRDFLEEGPVDPYSKEPQPIYTEDMLGIAVTLSNDSEEVISEVQLWIEPEDHVINVHEAVTADHDVFSSLAIAHAELRFVLPKTSTTVMMMVPWGTDRPPPNPTDWIAVALFTDARDNQWIRRTGEPLNDSDENV